MYSYIKCVSHITRRKEKDYSLALEAVISPVTEEGKNATKVIRYVSSYPSY